VEQVWYTAAAWVGVALLASLISIRIGISVALVEIFLGFFAGNLGTHLHTTIFQANAWINFLAGFGSMVLTFLAGAEIEPESFRRNLAPSLVIGSVSFLLPFLGAMAFTHYISASMTRETQALAVVVSESSVVRVFAKGELIEELIPEVWVRSR